MFKRIASILWGDFESREEIQKYAFLSAVFFLIIGIYWALRPIKDTLFFAIIGREYLWQAKILSLLVISPLVVFYSKLIDTYEHHKVFYVLIGIYSTLALAFMWGFMHPEIGLLNVTRDPSRLIGWAWYVFVESYGSLFVALFWAFVTDITGPDSARRGFPLIVLFGQMGNIVGPTFITAKSLGFSSSGPVVGVCAALMLFAAFVFWIFMKVTPRVLLKGYQARPADVRSVQKRHKADFLEGLRILITEKYLLGMFSVIFLYEMLTTVFDYHLKQAVGEFFPIEVEAAAYLASYAQWVGIVSTASVFFGINNIQRYVGMTASLLLLPLFVACAVLAMYLYPAAINVVFWIMVLSKAVNYALNQPTMKQLYIPTTPEVKYKAQAWLEMFGSRGSKAVGSLLNSARGVMGLPLFMTFFSSLSIGLIGVWVLVAMYIARTYNQAIKERRVVC